MPSSDKKIQPQQSTEVVLSSNLPLQAAKHEQYIGKADQCLYSKENV